MKAEKVKVSVFFATLVAVEAVINPHGPTIVKDYTNCINALVEENFEKSDVLIFASYNNSSSLVTRIKSELLNKIHKTAKYAVEIKIPQNELDVCDNYDEKFGIPHIDAFEARPLAKYFVIITDTYKEISYIVSRLIRSRSWNPSAKFIILLLSFTTDKNNINHVEKTLSCLFKYNAINIVVIVPEANHIRNAVIYSWHPYDPPKYCGYYNETAHNRLSIENICEKGALRHQGNIFGDKVPINLTGCVLHIIALERKPYVSRNAKDNANIEKVFINEVVKRYNLKTSYDIVNLNRGERVNRRQWNGALAELVKKKGQLLLGSIFPDNEVHEDFECSLQYLADSYTWVVPRAYQSPPWTALGIIFHNFVWYSVIGGFFVCAMFWRILGQLSKDAPRNRSLKHCFLNAWICSLGFCSYLRPTKASLRLFYVFFNVYCILVVTGYQTKLIDVLQNPTFEYQIQTIEELVASGLKFGGFEELHDLFLNFSDPLDSFIYKNWIDIENVSLAMIDVTVHRNFSLLCSRLELAYISTIVPDLSDSYGNFKYYAFGMNTFSVSIESVALKGFGLLEKISESLSLFKQAGINEAIRIRFRTFNRLRRAKLLRSLVREMPDFNALSVKHLQGGFLVLALGYISGTLVLVIEIISSCDFVRTKFPYFNK